MTISLLTCEMLFMCLVVLFFNKCKLWFFFLLILILYTKNVDHVYQADVLQKTLFFTVPDNDLIMISRTPNILMYIKDNAF